MYSTHNECKSVITERFIKTLKAKIYKKMTANDSKLVDQYNNIYHHSINKKPIDDNYSALAEKIETEPKVPKFKVNHSVRKRIFLVKVILEIGQEKYLLWILS